MEWYSPRRVRRRLAHSRVEVALRGRGGAREKGISCAAPGLAECSAGEANRVLVSKPFEGAPQALIRSTVEPLQQHREEAAVLHLVANCPAAALAAT
jgi:hypothetical protein